MYLHEYILISVMRKVRRVKLQKWGNSLAVRIPADILKELSLKSGSELVVGLRDKEIVLKAEVRLDSLLEDINPDNLHRETYWGERQGNEVW